MTLFVQPFAISLVILSHLFPDPYGTRDSALMQFCVERLGAHSRPPIFKVRSSIHSEMPAYAIALCGELTLVVWMAVAQFFRNCFGKLNCRLAYRAVCVLLSEHFSLIQNILERSPYTGKRKQPLAHYP